MTVLSGGQLRGAPNLRGDFGAWVCDDVTCVEPAVGGSRVSPFPTLLRIVEDAFVAVCEFGETSLARGKMGTEGPVRGDRKVSGPSPGTGGAGRSGQEAGGTTQHVDA